MTKIARPNKPLADVNVLDSDGGKRIVVCFMPDPDALVKEGESRVAVALDASRSMKEMFGGMGVFDKKPNYAEAVGRKLGEYLCGIARSGKVPTFYWALGPGGAEIEPAGEMDSGSFETFPLAGPKQKRWGGGTKMLPILHHIADEIAAKADWTMAVIITDGIIEDQEQCGTYCLALGRDIVAAKRRPLKIVLIGVGNEIDEKQLEYFDDLFENTDLSGKVDLFSHGIAASMRDEADIIAILFGELMSEDIIVAESARILSGSGKVLATFSDGLPGKFEFTLPHGETRFSVETPAGTVMQDITDALEGN